VDELRDRVTEARVARLATIDPEGRPHLVPVCFALDGDTVYSAVDQKPKRSQELQRLRNIRANPAIALIVDHYDEDWTQLWWVRLRGRAAVLEPGPERERALALLADKYEQYRADPPRGDVLAVRVEEWRSWSAV
jgi:PPOX class probable F420-dependent enzyme